MKVSIIALLCCVAVATAAPAKPDLSAIVSTLIDKLQNIANSTQNQHLANIINTGINQIQSHLGNRALDIGVIANTLIDKLQTIANSTQNQQLASILNAGIAQIQQHLLSRGIAEIFGISAIWQTIKDLHSAASEKFFQLLSQALFAGTQVWTQVKEVLAELTQGLLNHAGDAKPLLDQAVASLSAILTKPKTRDMELERGIASFFGLDTVWNIIKDLHTAASDKLGQLLTAALFAGKEKFNQIKAIVIQLAQNIIAHASDASPLVNAAVAQISQILGSAISGQRNMDVAPRGLMEFFGLDQVWNVITSLHTAASDKLGQLLTAALFAGKEKLNQVKAILIELAKNLTLHASDASPLVSAAVASIQQILNGIVAGKRDLALERGFWDSLASTFGLNTVWSIITGVASDLKNKFFLTLEKLLFSGVSAWNAAKPVFADLVVQLTSHAQDAVPLLNNAISSLTAIIAGKTRAVTPAFERGIFDYLYNLFGLGTVFDVLSSLGTQLKEKFTTTLWELFNAGVGAWGQATSVFSELVSSLTNHAGDAKPLIEAAIAQIHAIATGAISGRADLTQARLDILGSLASIFGLGNVWDIISGLHNQVSAAFTLVLEKLLFAGGAVWADAKQVLKDLAKELLAHASDAVPLLQNATSQLTAIINQHIGK